MFPLVVAWQMILQVLLAVEHRGAPRVAAHDGGSAAVDKVVTLEMNLQLLQCHEHQRAAVMGTEVFGCLGLGWRWGLRCDLVW